MRARVYVRGALACERELVFCRQPAQRRSDSLRHHDRRVRVFAGGVRQRERRVINHFTVLIVVRVRLTITRLSKRSDV